MKTVRIAAVQAAPVWLDRQATIETVVALAEQAAAEGAGLVAFPEALVPGYPDWVWRTRPWDHHATELYARLLDQAVVVGSAATDTLADAARRLGIRAFGRCRRARHWEHNGLQHAPPFLAGRELGRPPPQARGDRR